MRLLDFFSRYVRKDNKFFDSIIFEQGESENIEYGTTSSYSYDYEAIEEDEFYEDDYID